MTPVSIAIQTVRGAALLLSAGLAGCTSIAIGEGERTQIVAVGIVTVKTPASTGTLTAVERSGLGLGWDNTPGSGGWLGFSEASWVQANPADCQMLIVIRSPAQAENARQILAQMEDQKPCLVDHTKPPQP